MAAVGAAALGDRARGTHTAAGAEAGHGYWWRTAREAWARDLGSGTAHDKGGLGGKK